MRTTGGRNAQAACCVLVERGLHSQEHRVATLWSNTGAALPLSLRCLHVAWPLSQTMMLQKSARRQVLCTRAHHHSLRPRSPASFGKMVVLHAEINLSNMQMVVPIKLGTGRPWRAYLCFRQPLHPTLGCLAVVHPHNLDHAAVRSCCHYHRSMNDESACWNL